jgi:hypothetical protein
VIDAVEADDFVALGEEGIGEVEADEPRRTSYKYFLLLNQNIQNLAEWPEFCSLESEYPGYSRIVRIMLQLKKQLLTILSPFWVF